MKLSGTWILVASLFASSSGQSAEQIVHKSLGNWVCKAIGFYSLNIDPSGTPKLERDVVNPNQVKITVEQELQDLEGDGYSLLSVDGGIGSKLRIVVSGEVVGGLFDTKDDGEIADGAIEFGNPMSFKWEERRESVLDIRAVYDNGLNRHSLASAHLQKDRDTWLFSLTKQDTTSRVAKELQIYSRSSGLNFEAGAKADLLTGECLRQIPSP
jgi:hypothetical protein